MSTICGRYVRTFAEADTGLLLGVSLNAPYPFFWVELVQVQAKHILCTGAGEEMTLPVRATPAGQRARVTIQDPLFGPQDFDVAPMLQDGGRPIASTPDLFGGAK